MSFFNTLEGVSLYKQKRLEVILAMWYNVRKGQSEVGKEADAGLARAATSLPI